jgi:hypothetical protein
MPALVPFLLFVAAFIARVVHRGLHAEDFVLWMVAGLAALTFTPVYTWVQSRRTSA